MTQRQQPRQSVGPIQLLTSVLPGRNESEAKRMKIMKFCLMTSLAFGLPIAVGTFVREILAYSWVNASA